MIYLGRDNAIVSKSVDYDYSTAEMHNGIVTRRVRRAVDGAYIAPPSSKSIGGFFAPSDDDVSKVPPTKCSLCAIETETFDTDIIVKDFYDKNTMEFGVTFGAVNGWLYLFSAKKMSVLLYNPGTKMYRIVPVSMPHNCRIDLFFSVPWAVYDSGTIYFLPWLYRWSDDNGDHASSRYQMFIDLDRGRAGFVTAEPWRVSDDVWLGIGPNMHKLPSGEIILTRKTDIVRISNNGIWSMSGIPKPPGDNGWDLGLSVVDDYNIMYMFSRENQTLLSYDLSLGAYSMHKLSEKSDESYTLRGGGMMYCGGDWIILKADGRAVDRKSTYLGFHRTKKKFIYCDDYIFPVLAQVPGGLAGGGSSFASDNAGLGYFFIDENNNVCRAHWRRDL